MKHPGAIVLAIALTLGGGYVLTTDSPSFASNPKYCVTANERPARLTPTVKRALTPHFTVKGHHCQPLPAPHLTLLEACSATVNTNLRTLCLEPSQL